MFNFFPTLCGVCGINNAVKPHKLCSDCHLHLPWLRETKAIDASNTTCHIRCAYYYEWPINRLLHVFKFQNDMHALDLLMHCKNFLPPAQSAALLPVPISQKRLAKRGFNQSLLIAKKLSKHWSIPIWQGVNRIRHTPHQRLLNRAERQNNLKDAFQIVDKEIPQSIVIVDDVLTTGATFAELATTLLKKEPSLKIEGFVLAYRPLATVNQ